MASAWLTQWGHSLSERTQGAMLAKNSLLDTVCLWDQLVALNLCSLGNLTWVGTSDQPAVAW